MKNWHMVLLTLLMFIVAHIVWIYTAQEINIMTRSELQYEIWKDLGYLECKTPKEYQHHLWRLSDSELFNLWLNIHNAKEAYKNG